ncbi:MULTISPECIES: class I SAM-dependent methyltransferase [unclassified Shinella]|uniref:class I SAM-dependent methyltransferase n=1 Tax=unclassified Shinella TaxID=2643062 RepID=UPI00225C8963|nr:MULTISPECIES: class I SAM-dependent methyltransferase [unclassified Shinella]MCO5139501.1 methyltransferase domain-containing protein [Shinella sp.]MDC7255771.1 methyltransferase domain-containing protein [Shinella sp. YE25]CAI0338596.1 Pimeloyl-CoA biosynthesis protein BioC [Rhizobiaceae bacterium]CAK7257035.1 Pimeloyl-CoA biosynthesis protein BioC [Shinella sp. WSC3-e]
MAQNIYDQPAFFEGYSSLPRSVHGLAGAAEWEAVRALLPDLAGKRIVDLGCGFGWFARHAAEAGAESVLGLDLSENMIARARAETASPAVRYEIADLDRLELPAGAFDFAYSSLAFHYIADFGWLVRTVHAALVPGASFVFTIEHPLYMAPSRPDWAEIDGRTVWPVDGYLVEGPRTTDWLAKGVVKHHRTLGTTLNALIAAGFSIRHVEEWQPSEVQLAAHPEWQVELNRPMFLLIACERS